MKRSLPLLLAPALAACHCLAADGVNLALNPSFETADAKGAIADDWIARDDIPVERRTDGGHTGAAYVRFRDDDPGGGQFLECRRVPARPGGAYTAAAWFRAPAGCKPGVYVNFYDALGHRVAHRFARIREESADWQRVEVGETAPADAWEVAVAL